MTTRIADRSLRARGDLDAKARKQVIDQVAATVILQDWLDHRPDDEAAEEAARP